MQDKDIYILAAQIWRKRLIHVQIRGKCFVLLEGQIRSHAQIVATHQA